MGRKLAKLYILLTLLIGLSFSIKGQAILDSIAAKANPDTSAAKPIVADLLKGYSEDSSYIDYQTNTISFYNKAVIEYLNLKLEAGYIEVNLNSGVAKAYGIPDSTGAITQQPIFTESDKVYKTDTMVYNFNTKKARIKKIITQEGEGYLHGEKVKRVNDKVLFIKDASFTTCNLEHPHFNITARKAKVIVGEKIVTGPAFLRFGEVWTPLFVPFGFFPTNAQKTSGVIMPNYTDRTGNTNPQGIGLTNGGYFWAVNDYMDMTFLGDIYSFGGYALSGRVRYVKKYKYNGNFQAKYSNLLFGVQDLSNPEDIQRSSDINIDWSHHQDPKSNPNFRFNAEVHVATPAYFANNEFNRNDFLTNTLQSSLNFTLPFPSKPYTLNVNGNLTQDLINQRISLRLPSVVFNVNRLNPFERKDRLGAAKWYERIGMTYNFQTENYLDTEYGGNGLNDGFGDFDFVEAYRRDGEIGAQHRININTNEKLFKYFTLKPSLNYSERWYTSQQNYSFNTTTNELETDTVAQFSAVRDLSMAADVTTNVYGLFRFDGYVKALRHVFTPTVRFSYTPDYSGDFWDYYQEVQVDSTGRTQELSRYRGYLYGAPGLNGNGVVGFNLNNTLEAKVKSRSDSVSEKKMKILEGFNISTRYKMMADEFKWDNLRIDARTSALIPNLSFNYNGTFDFYGYDSTGTRINESAFDLNKRAVNHLNSNFSVNYSLSGNFGNKQEKQPAQNSYQNTLGLDRAEPNYYLLTGYLDFNMDWSLDAGLSYYIESEYTDEGIELNQRRTLTLGGTIKPTKNWRFLFTTGYDFEAKEITRTDIRISRSLHCWELNLNWIPFGFQQQYTIGIRIKAQMFQDVKMERSRRAGN